MSTQYFTFAEQADDFLLLDSGVRFGPITVAYETYGTLNERADNAILVTHALTGDAHAAGYHSKKDDKAGWWESMIGPGKAFDTDKYFVICSNVLGGCVGTTGPSSLDPRTGRPYGLDFPVVTIGDMVKVQKRLVEHLGIHKLLCVAGGSMGGMQSLEWGLRYPDAMHNIMVIASTARLSAQSIAFDAVGRNAILSDPHFEKGNFYGKPIPAKGLSIARMIGHITYLSDLSMHKKFGRRLQKNDNYNFDFNSEFEVESYLDYQGNKFVERFDANTYLYVTKAMSYFDVASYYDKDNLAKAVEAIKARILVVSFTSDWLFPPYQSQELVKALIHSNKKVSYFNIESPYGHDSFLLEFETLTRIVESSLYATYHEVRGGRNE